MRKLKSLVAVLIATAMMAASLTACGPSIEVQDTTSSGGSSTTTSDAGGDAAADSGTAAPAGDLTFAEGTVLRMATGYNSKNTGLFFDADTAGSGITLADGVTYNSGDLKPTWVEVEKRLGMKFEDKYQGNGSTDEFNFWKEQLDQVDMVSGTATLLSENGVAGNMVNIAEFLDMMPNFKAYLEANPIVRMSIVGDTTTGAIYFSPYFDGVDDIERMPLMRTDWVAALLNGEGEFTADASNNTAAPVYQPYMPTSGKVEIEVVKADGSGVETVTKDYDTAGNIIEKMNAAGSMSGVDAVNMLRTYIDECYGGYYGTERADLFIGQNAAWDADELVALLRCVVANPQTLNGTDHVNGLFSREDGNNQRRVDMFRFAGTLFGVRGLESRKDYLYVGNDGALHDARQEPAAYEAMERMNALAKENLISDDFKAFLGDETGMSKTENYLKDGTGFMHYDYNQTQTIYNESPLDDEGKPAIMPLPGSDAEHGDYMAVMVPVARWDDGTGEKFMRFTESWRSVKTDGWGISVAGVGYQGDGVLTDKLAAALKLIDYAYSDEGQILMSYGPDAFIGDGTFNFNGKEMPVIADATRAELWDKQNGNYTNYARRLLGSTLSFLKSQAFEYQCTTEAGRLGAGYISNAIALGTIHHPELAVADNMWYTSVPTVLPLSETDSKMINENYPDLNSQFNQNKSGENVLLKEIVNGYTFDSNLSDANACADYVANTWGGKQYLQIQNDAWDVALDYYNNIA